MGPLEHLWRLQRQLGLPRRQSDCVSNAQEQDAVLMTAVVNPYVPKLTPSYYPVDVRWNHKLNIGTTGTASDEFVVVLSDPSISTVNFNSYTSLGPADNTAVYAPQTLAFPPGDFFAAASTAPAAWSSPGTSGPRPARPSPRVGTSTTSSSVTAPPIWCPRPPAPVLPATTARSAPAPAVRPCSTTSSASTRPRCRATGAFWLVSPDWNALDAEFPNPTVAGETVGLVATENTGSGTHPGTMGLNGRRVTVVRSPRSISVSPPVLPSDPAGPPALVPAGQPIVVSWTPFTESGSSPLIKGYKSTASTPRPTRLPPRPSRLPDQRHPGGFHGRTGDINTFTDVVAPRW